MNQPIPAPHDAYQAGPPPVELPLRAIQRLGRRTTRDGMYLGLIIALVAHVAAVGSPDYTLWMMHVAVGKMNRELKAYFERTEEVEVLDEKEKEKEDKPEPEPPPIEDIEVPDPDPIEPPPPAPDSEPETQEDDTSPYDDPEPYEEPAPQTAEAQDVLTTDDGVVDMTGEGWDIHDNDGSTSRGTGATSKSGRKDGHVSNPNARPDGTGDGPGTGPPKPRPKPRRPKKDMSSPVKVLGGISNCPFPAAADLNQVDRAVVVLSVTVGSSGRATRASVVSDPGYGFGAKARACSMNGRYEPARNRDGRQITKTITLRVRFTR